MNRRDMIIVATLMNTGLLAILFMMAIHSDDQPVSTSAESMPQSITETLPPAITPQPILPKEPALIMAKTVPHDELDQVIQNYSTPSPKKSSLVDETIFVEDEPIALSSSLSKAAAAPVFAPASKSEPKLVEVTVKKGDSLDKIARANKTSIKALKRANKLTTDCLQVGQILSIPVGVELKPTIATVAPSTQPISSFGSEFYTIKSGDNPWKIAKQFGVGFEQLLRLNQLDEAKARRLKAGDRIRVR